MTQRKALSKKKFLIRFRRILRLPYRNLNVITEQYYAESGGGFELGARKISYAEISGHISIVTVGTYLGSASRLYLLRGKNLKETTREKLLVVFGRFEKAFSRRNGNWTNMDQELRVMIKAIPWEPF